MKDDHKISFGRTVKLDKNGNARLVFRGVAAGDYAIKVFVDQNGNGKLDKNFLGIPKEPYGLSNDIKPRFSMPSWEQLKFTIKPGITKQSITLRD